MGVLDIKFQVSFCDNCNMRGAGQFHHLAPELLPRLLKGEEFPGTFPGGIEDAMKAGWEERDYGLACPACVTKEREQEERDVAEHAESGGLGLIAEGLGLAKKPEVATAAA